MNNRGTAERLIDNENGNQVIDLNVVRENHAQPLRECAEAALRRYFKDLDGHIPGNLYMLVVNEVEEPLLRAVLEFTRGNQSRASEILGINRSTLRKKLRAHGLHN
ncbi:MAG TPA: DNA-binding transcriptional regulator Fis [Gammaproteobacteria bacterium]